MCVWCMCTYFCVCAHTQMLEKGVRYLSPDSFETWSLTESRAGLTIKRPQWPLGRCFLIMLGFLANITVPGFLHVSWGFKLRPSCLHSLCLYLSLSHLSSVKGSMMFKARECVHSYHKDTVDSLPGLLKLILPSACPQVHSAVYSYASSTESPSRMNLLESHSEYWWPKCLLLWRIWHML